MSEWVSQRVSVLMCVVLTTLCVGVGKLDENKEIQCFMESTKVQILGKEKFHNWEENAN